MNKFSELNLSNPILRAVEALGFVEPTPIQQKVIPILSTENRDIIALAQTGTGKTAAFGLPLLEKIDTSKRFTQGLIVAPTRELGQQIADQILAFSKFMPKVNVQVVYGGTPIVRQMRALKNTPQIIIATPGRLIDLLGRRAVFLDKLKYVVLDEADEMLNMGFKEDIDKILESTPEEKLTWLFSATMPKGIRAIGNTYMTNPIEISVSQKHEVNKNIDHQYAVVKAREKTEVIKRIIDANPDLRCIIFCRTKLGTQSLGEELRRANYKAEPLHGDLSQAQRDRVMNGFKAHHFQILLATDVAARGIDVADISHVIHHQLPDDMAYYTHRSGRTARAGKKGVSLSLIIRSDVSKIRHLERKLKIEFSKAHIPGKEEIAFQRTLKWASKIANTEIDKNINPELLEQTEMILEASSKEELIKKLLTLELGKISISSKSFESANRSERRERRERTSKGRDGERGRNRDRRDSREFERPSRRDRDRVGKREKPPRSPRRGPRKNISFFINMGTMDGIDKRDLAEYISDVTRIDVNDIENVRLQQKHAYFDVDAAFTKIVSTSFKGKEHKGRKLRVNRNG